MVKMKTLIHLLVSLTSHLLVFGQEEMVQSTRDDLNYGRFRPDNLAPIYGISERPGQILGSIYPDTVFRRAAVVFDREIVHRYDSQASDSVSGYFVRLNLLEKLVEFRFGSYIKGIEYHAIRRIHLLDEDGLIVKTFAAAPEIINGERHLEGFAEQVFSGEHLQVVKGFVLRKKEPSYHAALAVGDKNAYYYVRAVYLARLHHAPWRETGFSRRSWLVIAGPHAEEMERFLKKENSRLKDEAELIPFCRELEKWSSR